MASFEDLPYDIPFYMVEIGSLSRNNIKSLTATSRRYHNLKDQLINTLNYFSEDYNLSISLSSNTIVPSEIETD